MATYKRSDLLKLDIGWGGGTLVRVSPDGLSMPEYGWSGGPLYIAPNDGGVTPPAPVARKPMLLVIST